MPLISRKQEEAKKELQIELSDKTLSEVKSYMKFAKLGDDFGWFFEEAAKIVFSKDKDYKAWLSESKKGAKPATTAEASE